MLHLSFHFIRPAADFGWMADSVSYPIALARSEVATLHIVFPNTGNTEQYLVRYLSSVPYSDGLNRLDIRNSCVYTYIRPLHRVAPCSFKHAAMSSRPYSNASCNGVLPWLSSASIIAPCLSSRHTPSTVPRRVT